MRNIINTLLLIFGVLNVVIGVVTGSATNMLIGVINLILFSRD